MGGRRSTGTLIEAQRYQLNEVGSRVISLRAAHLRDTFLVRDGAWEACDTVMEPPLSLRLSCTTDGALPCILFFPLDHITKLMLFAFPFPGCLVLLLLSFIYFTTSFSMCLSARLSLSLLWKTKNKFSG